MVDEPVGVLEQVRCSRHWFRLRLVLPLPQYFKPTLPARSFGPSATRSFLLPAYLHAAANSERVPSSFAGRLRATTGYEEAGVSTVVSACLLRGKPTVLNVPCCLYPLLCGLPVLALRWLPTSGVGSSAIAELNSSLSSISMLSLQAPMSLAHAAGCIAAGRCVRSDLARIRRSSCEQKLPHKILLMMWV